MRMDRDREKANIQLVVAQINFYCNVATRLSWNLTWPTTKVGNMDQCSLERNWICQVFVPYGFIIPPKWVLNYSVRNYECLLIDWNICMFLILLNQIFSI